MQQTKAQSLKKRAINSGLWVTAGYGFQQILRFASNLVLTRLLFPEAFGLMAIVQTVMVGLTMMSDFGIMPSIIQNKRGDEPDFLNTAWTIQVLQGVMIFLVICSLAPFFANFYHESILRQLLPVVGFSAVISGLNSTKLATANRNLHMAKVTLLELGTYVISLIITIFLAWMYKSVWALIWGMMFGNFLKMLASHFYLPGMRNHFVWEKPAVKAIFTYGSWIFVSSTLTFLAGEGNKLFVAKFLDVRMLAFYTLASTMSLIFWQAMLQLSGKILFPTYSEVLRDHPDQMNKVLAKARLLMIASGGLCALFFIFWGDQFMWFIYDDRYRESGVILQILGMGSLAGIIVGSYTGVFFAKGLVGVSTITQAVQIVVQVVAVIIGNYFYGNQGVIVALASIYWLLYPLYAYLLHTKTGLWQPKIDLPFLAVSALISYFVFQRINYI